MLFTLLAALLLAASAPVMALEWGKDYLEVPAQPTSVNKNQIEVLEFFWYRCPHCFHLEPELNSWARKLPRNVVLKRVPGILNDGWLPMARAYYALEAVGAQPRLHDVLFEAIHVKKLDLDTPDAFFDWAAKQGVDRKRLANAYSSFSVESKVTQARSLSQQFGLTGVPSFAVDGRYVTSAYLTGGSAETFKVLDQLIAQLEKQKY
jgi:thiol:disulfide interchange protein DsbA